jgi:hypothetical protein
LLAKPVFNAALETTAMFLGANDFDMSHVGSWLFLVMSERSANDCCGCENGDKAVDVGSVTVDTGTLIALPVDDVTTRAVGTAVDSAVVDPTKIATNIGCDENIAGNAFDVCIKRAFSCQVAVVRVHANERVVAIKERLQIALGVPVATQHLIYAGRRICDDMTLADYNISANMLLHLVVKGGGSRACIDQTSVLGKRRADVSLISIGNGD